MHQILDISFREVEFTDVITEKLEVFMWIIDGNDVTAVT
jgi:hypothetical protein